jgi:hypothetical protein
MSAPSAAAKALWFVWDGSEDAVLGRNDGRPVDVTPRRPDYEIFAVTALTANGEPGVLLDFFWVASRRAFLRPLVLPRDAGGVEVASMVGGRPRPLARYYLDAAQDRDKVACDIVFAQLRRDELSGNQSGFVLGQRAPFAEAEARLAPQQQNAAHTVIWAAAAPFEDLSASAGVLERRVGPLSTLFPRKAGLIKVNPVRYRKEKKEDEEEARASEDEDSDGQEPAIRSVASELRYVIALEVDVPLTELHEANAVPGLVVSQYMMQRELIQLWQDTTPLVRFTVADLEKLENTSYPFPPSGAAFAVRPLRAHEGLIQGLRISARDQRSGDGLVRRFTINFAFAILGDILAVCDIHAHRLVGEDGTGCSYLTFRVGADKIEYGNFGDPTDDERMRTLAQEVVESSNEALRHTDADNPNQILFDFLATQARVSELDAEDLDRRALLPLFTMAYAAHARQAPEVAERIKHLAFVRDPGVQSATFMTSALAKIKPGRPPSATAPFSMRLAAQLGAMELIMPPATVGADIQAADLLTNNNPRNRGLWDDAVAVGVKVDVGRADIDQFVQRLREFRTWYENPDIMDELTHTADETVSEAFRAFRDKRPPYQRPLAAVDFDRLFSLVQPVAIEVERAATETGRVWASGPAATHDPRTTEQLKGDLAKLLKEGLAHRDPTIYATAKGHAEANYVLRKQMREAEKELKDLIGSPAISVEILALIDRLEAWAVIDGAPHSGTRGASDDRRQRILDLARAFRAQPPEISTASHLGRDMDSIAQRIEDECSRFRPNAAAEDGDILSMLPSYARLLGFHVARRALAAARNEGADIPETATRLLSLWPERAADCWERHESWASAQVPAVKAHLTRPWTVEI